MPPKTQPQKGSNGSAGRSPDSVTPSSASSPSPPSTAAASAGTVSPAPLSPQYLSSTAPTPATAVHAGGGRGGGGGGAAVSTPCSGVLSTPTPSTTRHASVVSGDPFEDYFTLSGTLNAGAAAVGGGGGSSPSSHIHAQRLARRAGGGAVHHTNNSSHLPFDASDAPHNNTNSINNNSPDYHDETQLNATANGTAGSSAGFDMSGGTMAATMPAVSMDARASGAPTIVPPPQPHRPPFAANAPNDSDSSFIDRRRLSTNTLGGAAGGGGGEASREGSTSLFGEGNGALPNGEASSSAPFAGAADGALVRQRTIASVPSEAGGGGGIRHLLGFVSKDDIGRGGNPLGGGGISANNTPSATTSMATPPPSAFAAASRSSLVGGGTGIPTRSAANSANAFVNHSRTASKRIIFNEAVQVSLVPHHSEQEAFDEDADDTGEGVRLAYRGGGISSTRGLISSMASSYGQGGAIHRRNAGSTTNPHFSQSAFRRSMSVSAAAIPSLVPQRGAAAAAARRARAAASASSVSHHGGHARGGAAVGHATAEGYAFTGNNVKKIAVDNDDEDEEEEALGWRRHIPKWLRTIELEDGTVETPWMRLKHHARRFVYIGYVFLRLSLTDANRRRVGFLLGLGSVVVVVFIAAVLFTTLDNLNLIFLKMAESNSGETDLVLQPGGQVSEANSLNYSRVAELFRGGGEYSYHTPRIRFDFSKFINPWGMPTSPGYCAFPPLEGLSLQQRNTAAVSSYLWTNSTQRWTGELSNVNDCTTAECASINLCPKSSTQVSGALHFIDFDREDRMGLGRGFPKVDPPLADDECIIDESLAYELGTSVGQHIIAIVDAAYPMMEAYQQTGLADRSAVFATDDPAEQPIFSSSPISMVTLRVRMIVEKTYGKLPKDNTNFVLANYRGATKAIGHGFSPEATTLAQRNAFAEVNPEGVAGRIIFNFPPDIRTSKYVDDGYEGARNYGYAFADRIVDPIGFNQLATSMPIVKYLYDYRFFSMFLGLLIWLIIAALAFLSVVLIYSLLTINIESRTYELGVMRMEGFPRHTLSGLVIVGALLFAIPGWGIGLLLGQCAYFGIRVLLASLTDTDMTMMLSGEAIGWATLAGIGIPLVASFAPVLSILTQSLPDALNTERGRTKAVDYQVESASDSYFSWTVSGLGVLLSVFGFLIYYLFPKSLLDEDLSLLLLIFFTVLLMMLGGLILLTVNFERFVSTVIQYVCLFWEHDAIFLLVERNLTAHRVRNRKSTLMFALSLGFIIFISVAFDIQFVSMTYSTQREIGGDLLLETEAMSYADFIAVEELLRLMQSEELIEHFGYFSESFQTQPNSLSMYIETLGQFRREGPTVRAISPNYFESSDNSFLKIGKQTSPTDKKLSLGERLYTAEGSSQLILPTSYVDSMALDHLEDVYEMYIVTARPETDLGWSEVKVPFSTVAFIDLAPVMEFSKFPQDGLFGGNSVMGGGGDRLDAPISVPAMVAHSQGGMKTVRQVTWTRIVIGTYGSASKAARVKQVLYDMRDDKSFKGWYSVSNVHTQGADFDSAKDILNFFFYFTQIMATAICFFALLSSMSTNILHQAKEIGVLRCLGLGTFGTYRIYLWESFTLVFAASLMGLVVGTVVAYTMLLQNSLFTQLPLPFTFPYMQLVIIVGTSGFCAFFASYGPVKALLSMPSITHIIRRTV